MSTLRLAGLASGMDTDSMVESLMKVEKEKYYKVEKQVYKKEWEIEAYRGVTDKINKFQSTYMDLLSSTNMSSESYYRDFTSTVKTNLGDDSSAVSVTSTAGANAGTHVVEVNQVAERASITGVKSTGIIRTGDITNFNLNGKSIKVSVDGVTKEIELAQYSDLEQMKNDLQNKLNDAFGEGFDSSYQENGVSIGKVAVTIEGNQLSFQTTNGATKISVQDDDENMLFQNTTSSIDLSQSLEKLSASFKTQIVFGASEENDTIHDQIKFKINDVEFQFDKETSIKDIMKEVNTHEDLNVKMSFNSVSGKFDITSKAYGAAEKVEIEDISGNFFEAIGLDNPDVDIQEGKDTKVVVDGIEIVRNTKSFTVDGITYQANEVTNEVLKVDLSINTDKVYDKIKTFVDAYNELVGELDTLVNEEYDSDYQPLTEDEKSSLSSEQIEKLEKKAKTGLLRNDSNLKSLLSDLRSCFSGGVNGVAMTFSDIGIKTGTYTNKGKIMLDAAGQQNLKSAIADDLDSVIALFSKKSEEYPYASRTYTADQNKVRYNQEGLINRFSDVLDNYVSTKRNTDGKKGTLLELAGLVGDASEFKNTLTKELGDLDDKLESVSDKMNDKYERYYKKFAALETAMNKANSQSSYLTQLIGGSTSA